MKKLLVAVLLLLSSSVSAVELGITTSGVLQTDGKTYVSNDFGLKLSTSGDPYYMSAELRKMGVCPYYCGFDLEMLGLGAGVKKHVGEFTVFAEGGYYFIKATGFNEKFDENIYYYMANKFGCGGQCTPAFYGFNVETNNAPYFSLGIGTNITESTSIKFAYQYLKVWTNYVAYVTPEKVYPSLWHDPAHRDFSSIRVTLSYAF